MNIEYTFETFSKLHNDFMTDLKIIFKDKSKDIDDWTNSLLSEPEDEKRESRIIKKVLLPLKKYSKEIVCNDDRMFNMPIQFGKVDLSAMWYMMKNMQASEDDKNVFWKYIENLYICGNITLQPHKKDVFMNVVNNIKKKYGNKLPVEKDEDDEEEDGGFNAEAISKATEQLQGMFGSNPVLNNLVTDIASSVGDKLKGQDQMMLMGKLLSGDHSMFGDLLENMSSKYGEELRNTPINEEEIREKTQQLFGGMQNMFPGGMPGMPGMPAGFPNNDDVITDPHLMPQENIQNEEQLMAMQTQMEQMMSKLPKNMQDQLKKQMPQIPQTNKVRGNSQTNSKDNLQFALKEGFTEEEFNNFSNALQGSIQGPNSVVHEHWWKGIKNDFLSKNKWSEQAEYAIMAMCKDGLGPALETILSDHSEWKRIMAKSEGKSVISK
jgi:uncharacterized membrane protein YheB (UPF0754 family)